MNEATKKPDVYYVINDFFHNRWHRNLLNNRALLTYLNKTRGIPLETVREWKLGYAVGFDDMPDSPDRYPILVEAGILYIKNGERYLASFVNRLVIPILDAENRVIGFSGRHNPLSYLTPDWAERVPKWVNSPITPIFSKRTAVVGIRSTLYPMIQDFGGLILVEGAFDAIVLQRFGLPAVAMMGLDTGALQKILPYSDRLILFLDGDAAGHTNIIRLAERSLFRIMDRAPGLTIQVVFPPAGMDPDQYVLADLQSARQALRTAASLPAYITDRIISEAKTIHSPHDCAVHLIREYSGLMKAFPRQLKKQLREKIFGELGFNFDFL